MKSHGLGRKEEEEEEYSMNVPSTLPVEFMLSEKEVGLLRREEKPSGFSQRVESKPL